jgi:hypothetical protein
MDARVYFHLLDAIASAASAAELTAVQTLVNGTEMHRLERAALERNLAARERLLRVGEIEVQRPAPPRAD